MDRSLIVKAECLQGATEDIKDVDKNKESDVAGSTDSTASIRAVYELTAMVAHVHDDFDTDKPFQEESEGHLVAHVKVMNVAPSISDRFFFPFQLHFA